MCTFTVSNISTNQKSPQRGRRQCPHTLLRPVIAYTHYLVQLYSSKGKQSYVHLYCSNSVVNATSTTFSNPRPLTY